MECDSTVHELDDAIFAKSIAADVISHDLSRSHDAVFFVARICQAQTRRIDKALDVESL